MGHPAPNSASASQAPSRRRFYLNGIVGEHEVIDARTLPQVKMPNRSGFVPDPRPDVGKPSKTKKR
jgi:cytochrome c